VSIRAKNALTLQRASSASFQDARMTTDERMVVSRTSNRPSPSTPTA